MRIASNEMKMPSNYVDMSESEMEYSGGFNWKKTLEYAALVGVIAGFGTGLSAGLFSGTAKQIVAGIGVTMIVGGLASGLASTGVNE